MSSAVSFLARRDKRFIGSAVFDDLAQQHEDALLAGASRLCHVVSDDEDRVACRYIQDLVRAGCAALRQRVSCGSISAYLTQAQDFRFTL